MVPDPDELWTLREFAAWLKLTLPGVRGLLRRRELPPESIVRLGRRVRLRAALLRGWLLRPKAS